MIITFDLGNTDLTFGVYKNDELIAVLRTSSDRNKSVDEFQAIIMSLLASKGIELKDIEGTILSSVVRELTKTVFNAIKRILPEPIVLGPGVKTGLKIKCDNPSEVGADIVAGCVGAINKYKAPIVLADLGTASKIIAIDKDNAFIGCVIYAGVKTAAKTLTQSTSQLPVVSLELPKKIIGTNTEDCMNSGILYGNAMMVDGMIRKFEKEMNTKTTRIMTGGLSKIISQAMDEEHILDKFIVLDGLYYIYRKNTESK